MTVQDGGNASRADIDQHDQVFGEYNNHLEHSPLTTYPVLRTASLAGWPGKINGADRM